MNSATHISESPKYGARLLHQTLDSLSEVSPDRIYASIPCSSDLSRGFRDVTFNDMVRCSDFVASWIQDNIGRSTRFETVCYIGIPDLRSVAIFLGAVKCGYKVLFPSPRNPPTTNNSLLEQTQCSTVLYAQEVSPIVKQLHNLKPEIQCLAVSSFDEMLKGDGRTFSYKQSTFENAKNNPIVVLHSSGSTGIPKPVVMTHGTFAILDNERNLPGVPGRKNRDFSIWDFNSGGKFYHVFPYFHLAGFLSNIVNPIFTEASSPVLGPPLLPPSGSVLKEIMQHQNLRALYIPPAIAEQLLQEPEGINFFRGLDFLVYTGAPFSPAAGKQLVQVTELCSLYGSTEAFQVPQLVPSKEDWAYMEWNPNFKLEMQPSEDEKGSYELVLFTDKSTERISALNHNLPGVREWRTKDLFMPHPSKPNLWRYHGRRDDIIVLSNSEKFNPVPMELAIQGHPMLAGALVVGLGRARASLVVEPKPNFQGDEKQSLIETIWPRVEEANALVPGHGRILRSNIIISDKPFTRAGKGTIVRKLTEQSLKEEIDALYNQEEISIPRQIPILKATFEREAVLEFVRSLVTSCFPAATDASDGDDLFSYGLDSLKVSELVSTLKVGIQSQVGNITISWISAGTIYQHPSIDQLTAVFHEFLNSKKIPSDDNTQARISRIDDLLRVYTRNLPAKSSYEPSPRTTETCVALTGSTGTLGTYILSVLLKDKSISRIYCLNRGPDARQRQESLLIGRGLPESSLSKLYFMTVDIGQSQLGLSAEDFSQLVEDVDIILHNAWRVDFNLSLQSFEKPFIRSVQNIIEWSSMSKKSARIFFVTSCSAVMNSSSQIQETPAHDMTAALALGYSESKCVAEGLLAAANKLSGIPVTILRVGQCAGSTNRDDPPWPKQEWLYPVLKASKSTGLIASELLPIDWIAIDQVAMIISEIIKSAPESSDLQVFNIVHPRPVSWNLLVEIQKERFGQQAKVVSLKKWARGVRRSESSKIAGPTLEPALRLVDLIADRGPEIEYNTEKSVGISATMAMVKPIDKALLEMWLDQWEL